MTITLGPPMEKIPAYKHVADRIRRAIQLGDYARGERLPSEVQLVEQLGFSRVTVREAVRHLEGEGYIESRRGAKGGLFVQTRRTTRATQLAALRAEWQAIDNLFEFRIAIESRAARIAAGQRDETHLARLARSLDALREGSHTPDLRRADTEFHLAIADACANPYLQQASEEARAGMFLPFDAVEFSPELWAEQPAQHAAILDAIRAGDAERAADAMTVHLEASQAHIEDLVWASVAPPVTQTTANRLRESTNA
jgi:GntR family transcriptional repressor for pyruvate dehydrogenase complex